MVQVVICGNPRVDGSSAAQAVETGARAAGVELAPIEEIGSPLEAIDRVERPGKDPLVDILVLADDLPGYSGVQLIAEIMDSGQDVSCVLFSPTAAAAAGAAEAGACGYFVEPAQQDRCTALFGHLAEEAALRQARSIDLQFRDGVHRIPAGELVYAETSGRDQVVHLSSGKTHALRSSSTAFFEHLAHDARFFKAGSSYIVNLQHVRCVTTRGQVVLSTGAIVTAPMRLRKPLEEALLAYSP